MGLEGCEVADQQEKGLGGIYSIQVLYISLSRVGAEERTNRWDSDKFSIRV